MGFTIGDTVRAVNGPLKGSVGEITSVSGNLAIEVLVAKSPVRAFEGSKTFFRMDQLKVLQKGKRASHRKSAHFNKITSKKLVKIIESKGIQLPYFFEDMDIKEAKRITAKVGNLLGNLMARILITEGQIVIKGTKIIPVKKPKQLFYAAITSSTGKFIAVDRHFQGAFLEGFQFSDYLEDIQMGLHEEAANYPVPASDFSNPQKLIRRIDFTVMGSDLVITFRRQNLN
jgi:hypothetical protein